MYDGRLDLIRVANSTAQSMAGAAESFRLLLSATSVASVHFEQLAEPIQESKKIKGNKRNGTLDRKQAFGGLFPKY